jgi:RNA polymerase sigma-70 factor, ECF subfamily
VTEPAQLADVRSPAPADDPSRERRQRIEQLHADHAAAVFGFARRRTSWADADEVVSETFLVAWRRLEAVPAGGERPWLLGIARHVLANQRRSAARQTNVQLRLAQAGAVASPVDRHDAGSDRIRRALDQLSAADRDALTLLAWDGLSPAEIAVVLGCTRAAAYVRIHRARRRLAVLLSTTPSTTGGPAT